ncbi:hypothetical protein DPMN_190293 [Dreissena polymorpha]|uniref:Uncharacterized protein n=1 Tax=Dreissena polymorpha TaxID=45954 RepID=A0A9D4DVX2_DREPO|nr:hypothetical protein DPMN_190293 [Dreissena polymorpha]
MSSSSNVNVVGCVGRIRSLNLGPILFRKPGVEEFSSMPKGKGKAEVIVWRMPFSSD